MKRDGDLASATAPFSHSVPSQSSYSRGSVPKRNLIQDNRLPNLFKKKQLSHWTWTPLRRPVSFILDMFCCHTIRDTAWIRLGTFRSVGVDCPVSTDCVSAGRLSNVSAQFPKCSPFLTFLIRSSLVKFNSQRSNMLGVMQQMHNLSGNCTEDVQYMSQLCASVELGALEFG